MPSVTPRICFTQYVIQLLPFPALSYFIFSGSGFCLRLFTIVALSLLVCHALHIMSSCAFHLHTCSSHASEHFPRCPFCNPAFLSPPVPLSTSFHVWALNISGLDQDFPCGLGLLPVDRPSSFVSFGLCLILQRLTEGPKRPRVCCSPTPLHFGPKPTKLCSMS